MADPGKRSKDNLRVLAALVRRPGAPRFGGAANAARSLSRQLARRIRLDFAEISEKDDSEPWEGNTYYYRRGYYLIPETLRRYVPGLSRRELNALIFSTVPQLLREQDYDLLHVHCLHPIWAVVQMGWTCKRMGRPYILSTHGLFENYHFPAILSYGKLKTLAHRVGVGKPLGWVFRNAAGVLASSPNDLPILEALGIDAARVTIVPNGAEDEYFEQLDRRTLEAVREKYRLPFGKPLLLFVGHLKEHKGVDILIQAVSRLEHDFHAIVAGPHTRPAYAEKLMALVQEAGCDSCVTFTGDVAPSDLPALYQLCDLFVFPTKADTMPLVILEAMASGKAIVSTSVGGIPFQVGDEAAILIRPGDVAGLVEALSALLQNEARRRAMGEAGRRRAEQLFRWSRSAELAIEAYHKAVGF